MLVAQCQTLSSLLLQQRVPHFLPSITLHDRRPAGHGPRPKPSAC
jgi:hypothetical protein